MGIDLTGKVVIVTGGAKGIGQGCVTKFVESNAKVIIFDIDTDFANPKNLEVHKVDLSIEAQVKDAVEKVVSKHGRIDGLVNCAGIETYGGITDTTEEVWDKTFAVNVKN